MAQAKTKTNDALLLDLVSYKASKIPSEHALATNKQNASGQNLSLRPNRASNEAHRAKQWHQQKTVHNKNTQKKTAFAARTTCANACAVNGCALSDRITATPKATTLDAPIG